MANSFSNPFSSPFSKVTSSERKEDFWKPQEPPLHVAARNNDIAQLTQLLKIEGVNPNSKNHHHLTPLHLLLHNDHQHVAKAVEILLKAGADPNQQDNHGETPLHAAARHNHQGSLKLFHAHSTPNLTLRNRDGETPLHTAVRSGHANVVHDLLQRGAPADAWNNAGQTPRQLAKKSQEMCAIFHSLAPPCTAKKRNLYFPLLRKALGSKVPPASPTANGPIKKR